MGSTRDEWIQRVREDHDAIREYMAAAEAIMCKLPEPETALVMADVETIDALMRVLVTASAMLPVDALHTCIGHYRDELDRHRRVARKEMDS